MPKIRFKILSRKISEWLHPKMMSPWRPEPYFSFPAEEACSACFQMQWLNQNTIHGSLIERICIGHCVNCVLFAKKHTKNKRLEKGGHQQLHVKWATAKETLKRHSQTEYHKTFKARA